MSENDSEVTKAERIIQRLHQFNRKERDHLMKFALCEKPAAPRISEPLWKLISNGGTRPDPKRMFVGMDYHMNWLHAALVVSSPTTDESIRYGAAPRVFANEWKCDLPDGLLVEKNDHPIQDNQEDVDLLVAWFDQRWNRPFRLVLIEAKLDSSWDSKQFEKKRERLTLIKEDADKRGLKDLIQWNFMLLSPGNAPSRGAFVNEGLNRGRHEWLYQDINGKPREELWHERLEKIGGEMRVKRTGASSGEWEIEAIKGGDRS